MKFIFSIALIFFNLNSYAISINGDSLIQVLSTSKNDSILIDAQLNLGRYFEKTNGDSANFYYRKAIQIANKNKWWKKAGDAYLNQTFIFYALRDSSSIRRACDSALIFYRKADYKRGQINTYLNYGTFVFSFEDFQTAINALEKAKTISENSKEYELIAKVYNNLGLAYQYTGQYQKALDNHLKGLKIREKNNLHSVDGSYINVGIVYHTLNEDLNAIKYYKEAIRLAKPNNNKVLIALGMKNIGDAYSDLNQLDSAKRYYDKSIDLYEKLDLPLGLGNLYLSYANLEQDKGEYSNALNMLKKSLKLSEEHGNKKQLCSIHYSLAKVEQSLAEQLNDKKHINKALFWSEQSYSLAKELGLADKQNKCARQLAELYHQLNNNDLAYEYTNEAIQLTDSILDIEKTEAITRAVTEFETEQKELKIELMTQEAKNRDLELSKNESELKRQTLYILTIGVVLILCVVIIVTLVISYRQKQHSNSLLSSRNQEIEKKNEEKEILLKEIHHRVKNNLQIVSSLLDMQSMGLENDAAKSAVNDGQNRVKAMALIHEKLYKTDDISHIDIREYTVELLRQIASVYPNNKSIEHIVIADDIQLDIDTAVPLGLILSELITNAYKYAFNNKNEGYLKIEFNYDSSTGYSVKVSDNGVGLPNDFDITKTKSLGLKLVRRLTKQLYGNLQYSNDNGTVFLIHFKDTTERQSID